MIILDNIIFSLQRHGGVSVLWGELIKRIEKENLDSRYIEYKTALENKIRSRLCLPEHKLINPLYMTPLYRYFDLNLNVNESHIFHSSHYRINNSKSAINITTVHDFTYEFFRKGIPKVVHCLQKYHAIRKSDAVVCISENTKKDLLHFLPDVPKEKIFVIHNGASEDYHHIDDVMVDYSNYVLFVGGRTGYKNFKFVVDSLSSANESLLICGAPLSFEEMKMLDAKIGKDRYKSIIYPTNKELNVIYNSVKCLIYVSEYEGFGIPVIEAQKAGCPVIALNSSSIPEIIGNTSLLMNELSRNDFVAKLEWLNNENFRNEIVQHGLENSQRFSWNKMTTQYINLYQFLQERYGL